MRLVQSAPSARARGRGARAGAQSIAGEAVSRRQSPASEAVGVAPVRFPSLPFRRPEAEKPLLTPPVRGPPLQTGREPWAKVPRPSPRVAADRSDRRAPVSPGIRPRLLVPSPAAAPAVTLYGSLPRSLQTSATVPCSPASFYPDLAFVPVRHPDTEVPCPRGPNPGF